MGNFAQNGDGVMAATNQPSKEQVRNWLKNRLLNTEPPSDIKQIQRELGWGSTENLKLTSKAIVQAVGNRLATDLA